jgi:hypothetical protein
MKMPDFNANPAAHRWDLWRAFHIVDRCFTDFSTGECIWAGPTPDPAQRRLYSKRNVQIVATTDPECPKLYIPGEDTPIPAAWLSRNGAQYLAVDYDFNMAVRLMHHSPYGSASGWADRPIPQRFHNQCAVYWGGPGCKPVGDPIIVSPPWTPTREQKVHLKNLKDQAAAWALMFDVTAGFGSMVHHIVDGVRTRTRISPDPVPARTLMDREFVDLTFEERARLHLHGLEYGHVATEYPYLSTKP